MQLNQVFTVAKVFAIYSVILAHSRNVNDSILNTITERIGAWGVITFLILSGYFYNIDKYGTLPFFKRKVTTIIVPWFFTGTFLFLFSPEISFFNWMLWIVGYKTYLYYLTIIMCCFLFFDVLKEYINVLMFLSFISILITSFELINYYPYLNPLNWFLFFGIGVKLKNEKNAKFLEIISGNFYSFIIAILLFILIVFLEKPGGYFTKFAIINEFLGFCIILYLSSLSFFQNKIVKLIANYSFSIYLIHFLFFPIRKILPVYLNNDFIFPFCILISATISLLIGNFVSKKIKLNAIYTLLLGIR